MFNVNKHFFTTYMLKHVHLLKRYKSLLIGGNMIKKIFKDRLDIIRFVIIIVFIILIFSLADLQIAQGEMYKKRSESLRIRSISVPAPRGNILDKFGRLIAGNKQSYSVNIMKTDISKKNIDDIAISVINIIEQNGDTYKDEIPILIDPVRFKFHDEKIAWKDKYSIPHNLTAQEAFIKLRNDYGILEEVSNEEAYEIITNQYAVELPFNINSFEYKYAKDEIKWKTANGFKEEDTAEAVFNALLTKFKIPREQYGDDKSKKILAVKYLLGKSAYKDYEPVEIAVNISEQTRAKIEENKIYLKGVEILEKPLRKYPNNQLASHIIGYMSKIGSELEELSGKGYTHLDMIGKTGIESSMEQYLKGIDGSTQIEVDASGSLINTIDQVDPTPGNNVFLTLDAKLQKVAEEAMKDMLSKIAQGKADENIKQFANARTAAVVAIDINTGKILAMASEPGYDPNLFAGGISNANWNMLQPQEKGRFVPNPLVNNAIQVPAPPGSAYKMLTGLAGLESGVITTTERIDDVGLYTIIPGLNPAPSCSVFKTTGQPHRLVNMEDAIKVSCNYYFFEVGRRMGAEFLEKYAEKFGFGQKTGVELPAEKSGSVEGPRNKKKAYKSYLKSYLINSLKIEDANIVNEVLLLIDKEPSVSEMKKKLQELGVTKSYASLEEKLNQLGINRKYSSVVNTINNLSSKNVDSVVTALKVTLTQKNLSEIKAVIQDIIDNIKIESKINSYIANSKWHLGVITSASIGQGATDATALQVASFIATLANGGTRYKPYLVDKVISYDGKTLLEKQPEIVEKIEINPVHLETIKKGMYNVVNVSGGTALKRFVGSKVVISGKTGTAQAGTNYDPHAWFVAFAPYDKPEIAVAAVVYQGGHGDYASPIARAIIEQYLVPEDGKDKIILENDITQ